MDFEYPRLDLWSKICVHLCGDIPVLSMSLSGKHVASSMSTCLACLDLEMAGRGAFASRESIG